MFMTIDVGISDVVYKMSIWYVDVWADRQTASSNSEPTVMKELPRPTPHARVW
jgi:hypothetical protein